MSKFDIENPQLLFLLLIPIPIMGIGMFFFGSQWLQLYSMTPFWSIFGTGLSIMSYYGGVGVVMVNRKIFNIKRNRVNILDRV